MDNKIELGNSDQENLNLDVPAPVTVATDIDPIKDDREAVTNLKPTETAKLSGQPDSVESEKLAITKALPENYTGDNEGQSATSDNTSSIYDKTASQAAIHAIPKIKAAKAVEKKLLPTNPSLAPSNLAKRVKAFSAKKKAPSLLEEGSTAEAESEIATTLQTIFGVQQIEKTVAEKTDEINRGVDRDISAQQFNASQTLQQSAAEGISRLVGYQDTVADKYYRKSLELQYRQFFANKDSQSFSRASHMDMMGQLRTIVKNTGLPNETKLKLSEKFHDTNKAALVDQVAGKFREFAKALPGKLVERGSFHFTDGVVKEVIARLKAKAPDAYAHAKDKFGEVGDNALEVYSKLSEKYPRLFRPITPIAARNSGNSGNSGGPEVENDSDTDDDNIGNRLDQHESTMFNPNARERDNTEAIHAIQLNFDKFTEKLTKIIDNINAPDDGSRLDALLSATETHALISETLLERIATATENIKSVAGSTTGIVDDRNTITAANLTRAAFGKIWGGVKSIFNAEMALRAKLKPIKGAIYGIGASTVRTLLPITKKIATVLPKAVFAVGKFSGKKAIDVISKIPGRVAKTAKRVGKAAGWLAGKAAMPAALAASAAYHGSKWLGKTALNTALKVPGRIARNLKSTKDLFKSFGGIGKKVKDAKDNIWNKFKKLSPIDMMSKMITGLQNTFGFGNQEIVKRLDAIYAYMQKAIPLKNSEQLEAERVGGVQDIINRRKAANDEKEAKKSPNGKAGAKAGAGILGGGMPNNLGNKDKDHEHDGDEESLLSKAVTWGSGAIVAGKALLGGGAAVGATEAVAGTVAAEGSVAAGGALLGSGALATAAALSNPVGWALLAGAGLYAGYKVYQHVSRKAKLKPLEMLRFLQYGVPINNTEAVGTIRYFEEEFKDHIEIPDSGTPKVDLKPEEIWQMFYKDFGMASDNPNDSKRFLDWVYSRFLPVFVKHTVLARMIAKAKLEDIDGKVDNDLKFKFVSAAQFGPAEARAGMDPYSVNSSPWYDIGLADNRQAIEALSKQIITLCQRGVNVNTDNLKAIKAVAPELAPKIPAKPNIPTPEDEKKKQEQADREAKQKEEVSFSQRAKDWARFNLMDPAKRVINKITEGAGELYESGKSAAKKAGSWINKNIFQPVSNSLAGLIRGAESGREGYNAYNRGTMGNKILGPTGHRDLTKMTLQEILDDSKRSPSDPQRLFAVGKYQMIPTTLTGAIKEMGIDPTVTLFDENTQERLFSGYLLDKKHKNISAFIKGKSDDGRAAVNAAASEWASIADPDTGASKYGNGNQASVSAPTILAAMNKSRELYQQYVAQGLSEDEAYQKAISTDDPVAPVKTIAPAVQPTGATPPIDDTEQTKTAAAPSTEASTAPTISAPSFDSSAPKTVAAPTATNSPATPAPKATQSPFAMAQIEQTTADIKAKVDEHMALSSANDIPVMPDLTHISKATYHVGGQAEKQRQAQMDKQDITNELLIQLVEATKAAPTQSKEPQPTQTIAAINAAKAKPKTVQPAINLSRNF